MGKYIHLFETNNEFISAYTGDDYLEPWVSYTEQTDDVNYNKSLLETPLTFEIISAGTIQMSTWFFDDSHTFMYKKNGDEWEEYDSSTNNYTAITVNPGDRVQFKSNYGYVPYGDDPTYGFFDGTSCWFKVFGNIMSVRDYEDMDCVTLSAESDTFRAMFLGCTGLTDASRLVLPATSLGSETYGLLFGGCTNLTGTPKLPATELATYCYFSMFQGCTSLTTAPELPATTMAGGCYSSMFMGCTSLVTPPALPSTALANYCYQEMFDCCTSLTSAPALPATTLADYCYDRMFYSCTTLTTAPALPATTLATFCYGSMFSDCTALTSAPALPATALTGSCYSQMFFGCTSLTAAPELPAPTLAAYCYSSMFSNCTSLNYIKCLATNISANNCVLSWVNSVQTTSGTFVKAPSMTSWTRGTSGIPNNWTVQDAS